jgi:hypothetical protein
MPRTSLITDEHRRESAEYWRKILGDCVVRAHAEGYAEAYAEQHPERCAEIYTEAYLRGLLRGFLRMLTERAIVPDSRQMATLMACTEPHQLERWLMKANKATCSADVFD